MKLHRAGSSLDHFNSDSSYDSINEILTSDDNDVDNIRNLHQHQRQQKESTSKCCLEDHLQSLTSEFPRSQLLLKAHQQIDLIHQFTRWTIIRSALQSFGPQSPGADIGDEKSYRRNNPKLPIYPKDCWVASVRRFLDRVDFSLLYMKRKHRLKNYARFLPYFERKAFKSCLQIWKKHLRYRAGEDQESQAWHQLRNSIDFSILCHSQDTNRLLICLMGKSSINLDRLREHLELKVKLSRSKAEWTNLELCGEWSSQIRSALYTILLLSNNFDTIVIHRHGIDRHGQNEQMAIPALVMQSQTIRTIHIDMREDDDRNDFTEKDFKTVLKRLSKVVKNSDPFDFTAPPRLAKLGAITSLIIRRHALDISDLPIHLQESVRTASRCSSCKRIMTSQRLSPPPSSLSSSRLRFIKQASQAGFKGPRSIVTEVIDSLLSDSTYLPPLSERFKIETIGVQESLITIGGSSIRLPSLLGIDSDYDSTDWQFCAACAALHFNIVKSTVHNFCECISCKREWDRSKGSFQAQWKREHPYIGIHNQ